VLIWLVVLLVAAAGIGLKMRPQQDAAYAQTFVTTGNISTIYSFTGSIVAPRAQNVTASAAGKVKEVYVEVNQTVEEGDRLLKLSSGEILKADIDGEVVSLNVGKDDTVGAGSVLLTVIDTARMEAEILIDEYDVGAVKIGRDVSVTVNALVVTTEGTLKSFNKQASSMGTMAAYKARVEFEVPENALQGMQVEVRMENQSAKNALLLSVDALQFDESNQVYVLTKNSAGEYVQTYVTTGINDGSTVQILSGLYNGQIVYYSAGMDMMQLMMEMRGRMK
jgi:HlyD family secretion protein